MRKLESKPEYHVLIADDESGIRSLLREWLQEDVCQKLPGTYVIYEAEDGQKATEEAGACQASGHSLDLAIVDLIMPGKSGGQVIDDLIKDLPSNKIVIFSATAGLRAEKLQERYGTGLTILTKPIPRNAFVDTVTRILSREGNSYA